MAAKDKAKYDAYVTILKSENIEDATKIIRSTKTDEETVLALKARFSFYY